MTFNRELEKDEKKIALCMLCSAGGWVNTRPTSVDAEHENNIKQPRSMVMDTLPFSSVHILSSYPTSKADKRQNVLIKDEEFFCSTVAGNSRLSRLLAASVTLPTNGIKPSFVVIALI